MYREAANRSSTMKSERKSSFDRFIRESRAENSPVRRRDRADERKEALALLAIALLFVANVVLYLCHHYGLTSLNEWLPRPELNARVVTN